MTEGGAEKEEKDRRERIPETEMVQRWKRWIEGRECLKQKWCREGREGQKGEDA